VGVLAFSVEPSAGAFALTAGSVGDNASFDLVHANDSEASAATPITMTGLLCIQVSRKQDCAAGIGLYHNRKRYIRKLSFYEKTIGCARVTIADAYPRVRTHNFRLI
jgi:hypothetical protein